MSKTRKNIENQSLIPFQHMNQKIDYLMFEEIKVFDRFYSAVIKEYGQYHEISQVVHMSYSGHLSAMRFLIALWSEKIMNLDNHHHKTLEKLQSLIENRQSDLQKLNYSM